MQRQILGPGWTTVQFEIRRRRADDVIHNHELPRNQTRVLKIVTPAQSDIKPFFHQIDPSVIQSQIQRLNRDTDPEILGFFPTGRLVSLSPVR